MWTGQGTPGAQVPAVSPSGETCGSSSMPGRRCPLDTESCRARRGSPDALERPPWHWLWSGRGCSRASPQVLWCPCLSVCASCWCRFPSRVPLPPSHACPGEAGPSDPLSPPGRELVAGCPRQVAVALRTPGQGLLPESLSVPPSHGPAVQWRRGHSQGQNPDPRSGWEAIGRAFPGGETKAQGERGRASVSWPGTWC